MLCDGTTESVVESVVGGDVQQHRLEEAELRVFDSSESQESASNTRDSQIFGSQSEDVSEFSLRPFLIKRPSLESIKNIENTRKFSTCFTGRTSAERKDSIDSEKKSSIDSLIQNMEQTKSDSHMSMLPYGSGYTGGIEAPMVPLQAA